MSEYELLTYIHRETELNIPKDKIVEHLLMAGWQQADIDRGFAEIGKVSQPTRDGSIIIDPEQKPKRERHVGKFILIFIVFNLLVFVAFSFLYNSVSLTIPAFTPISTSTSPNLAPVTVSSPIVTPSQTAAESTTPPTPQVVAEPAPPTPPAPVSGISSDDREQIIVAIITQGTVFSSGNAANIRNYLKITASPQYSAQLDAMSDSAILSLASTMTAGESYVNASSLNSAQATWVKINDTSVKVTIQTSGGSVSRTANEANGVWY